MTESRIKFAPASESDKQLLQRFCDACKGIPQVQHILDVNVSGMILPEVRKYMTAAFLGKWDHKMSDPDIVNAA